VLSVIFVVSYSPGLPGWSPAISSHGRRAFLDCAGVWLVSWCRCARSHIGSCVAHIATSLEE